MIAAPCTTSFDQPPRGSKDVLLYLTHTSPIFTAHMFSSVFIPAIRSLCLPFISHCLYTTPTNKLYNPLPSRQSTERAPVYDASATLVVQRMAPPPSRALQVCASGCTLNDKAPCGCENGSVPLSTGGKQMSRASYGLGTSDVFATAR